VSEALSDEDLRQLRRAGGAAACNDPKILALLTEIVERYPKEKIHWLLTGGREEILGGWIEGRLARGRLAAMIDMARSVRALRAIAAQDLQQYAKDERRGELPTRLFKRLDKILHTSTERFQVMVPSKKRGSTYWTLASRPASAIFSEREQELRAHVFAIGLTILPEDPDAEKQTQFLSATELRRYAYQMLERTARGLSLDQLVLGLVQTYGLKPALQELADEDLLDDHPFAGEREHIPTGDPPEPPDSKATLAAQALIDALTPCQIQLLKLLHAGQDTQADIAGQLGCSQATISSEKSAIAAALSKCAADREQQIAVISTTIKLLDGTHQ
jgi:DNA-binding NarL/FixJ family response regulator